MAPPRKPSGRTSAVPENRFSRFVTLGVMASEVLVSVVAGNMRRAGRSADAGERPLIGVSANVARRLVERLSHLRGAAMKLGQLLSLEGEDLLSPELTAALAALRSDANAMPVPQLRRVLGREWGHGWESRFADFDL